MGIGQGCAEGLGEKLRRGVEPGKGIVIAAVQGEALALEVIKIALFTVRMLPGNKHFSVFQAHINCSIGERLPTPGRVLEHQHVHPPTLEVTHTPGNGTGHKDKAVVALQLVEGCKQLRQQARVGAALGTYDIRRKVRSSNPDFLNRPHRCQPAHSQGQQQAVG